LRFGRRNQLSRSTERQNECLIAVSPAPTFALWAISLTYHSRGGEALAVNANENIDQAALRKWIEAGLAIPEVRELHGDAGYLLNNMIAKYTLASSFYAISESVLSEFNVRGAYLSATYPRRAFYGKQNGENLFIYEHTIPAGVVRHELLMHSNNPKKKCYHAFPADVQTTAIEA
jgi:hypothetical protein